MQKSMKARAAIALAAMVMASGGVFAATTAPSEAARGHHKVVQVKYKNCTALTKKFRHGVAKGPKAAKKQVRAGYRSPAYGKLAKKVYWKNHKSMDRDRDGTACER